MATVLRAYWGLKFFDMPTKQIEVEEPSIMIVITVQIIMLAMETKYLEK
jgi:hypothetical protein